MSIVEQIHSCTKCELVGGCNKPVPFDTPYIEGEGKICVIGEAPGADEDEQNTPFVGKSGQYLRNSLRVAGLKPSVISYMNVVCCRPHDNGKNRPPTQKEVTACRKNYEDQLTAIDPAYVLVVGATSLAVTLPSGVDGPITPRISDMHGRWWKMPGTSGRSAWAMATWHPAYVLRNWDIRTRFQEELQFFADVVNDTTAPVPNIFCIRCVEDVEVTVGEALGFCRKCAEAVGCDVEPDTSNKWVLTIHTTRVLVEAEDAKTALYRFAISKGYSPELVTVRSATVSELREFRSKRRTGPESLPPFDDLPGIEKPAGTRHSK